jgi:hypothetical protein
MRLGEHTLEQRGFARAEKAGEYGCGNHDEFSLSLQSHATAAAKQDATAAAKPMIVVAYR